MLPVPLWRQEAHVQVFGESTRVVTTGSVLEALRERFEQLPREHTGLERHAGLVNVLVEAGEWVQGVLDAQLQKDARDDSSPLSRLCGRLLLSLGTEVTRSLLYRFDAPPTLPVVLLERIGRLPLPDKVTLKVPHGYAHGALYPEAYARAGSRVMGPFRVIGLRSIGTSLSGVVAAATGSPPPVTLRPTGQPTRRGLALSGELTRVLTAEARDARFAVVDEGPGASGSSFAAVISFLETHGVPSGNIHLFASHPGEPGMHADDDWRAKWRTTHRHVTTLDELYPAMGDAPSALTSWMEPLIGKPLGPAEDLSAGAWRERLFSRREKWPGVNLRHERRKLRTRTAEGTFLLEFSGLARYGQRALALGRTLAEGGFVPEVKGLRHGFTVHTWLEGARPLGGGLGLSEDGPPRGELLEHLARYLAFRAQQLPVQEASSGASLSLLWRMAKHNTQEALGAEAARALERHQSGLAALEGAVRRVYVDGKMQPWEWLVTPNGRIWKTDAVHHGAGRELVGCQDVAWDVVGAELELGLDREEAERLLRRVTELTGHPVPSALVALYRRVYLAFRLGQDAYAAQGLRPEVTDEAMRLERQAESYARRLGELLAKDA